MYLSYREKLLSVAVLNLLQSFQQQNIWVSRTQGNTALLLARCSITSGSMCVIHNRVSTSHLKME